MDWREVADHLPPAWAIAAPDLSRCASADEIFDVIDADARSVSSEQIVVVSQGLSVVGAGGFYRARQQRVAAIVALSAQWKPSLAQMFALRSDTYFRALRAKEFRGVPALSATITTTIPNSQAQYPAQTAAALYRTISGLVA